MREKITYYRTTQIEIIHQINRPIVFKEHNHVFTYTLGMILNGHVKLKRGAQVQDFGTPGFFIIPPYQIHALILPKKYELVSISIHKDTIITFKINQLLQLLIEKLQILCNDINVPMLVEVLEALYGYENYNQENMLLSPSIETILSHPESNDKTQCLADKAYVSRSHFFKLFRETIGMTPHRFLLQNRIRKAQRLIENNEDLTTLAVNLGFYDQSHFTKCFKNIIGLTPLDYKHSIRII